MRSKAGGVGLVFWVALAACGGEADTLDDARLVDLTPAQATALCRRNQADQARRIQQFVRIACTDEARLQDDCDLAREACVQNAPAIDFDICESPEAAMRALRILTDALAMSPQFADVAEDLLAPPNVASSDCPLTVGQFQDCYDSQVAPLARAAEEYDCQGGDDALAFPVSDACRKVGNIALQCLP